MPSEFDGHTPGPWEAGRHPALAHGWIVRPVLFGSHAYALPECEGGHVVLLNEGNARLIAAAPALLSERDKLKAELEEARGILSRIHALLDFEDPIEPATAITIDDTRAINEAFAQAYAWISKGESDDG